MITAVPALMHNLPVADDTAIRGDSSLTIPHYVLSRRVGDETVLLNLDNEQYYGLDGVGSRFWEIAEGGTTLEQAVETLLGEFDVERSALTTDLNAIVVDLRRNGLLAVDAA